MPFPLTKALLVEQRDALLEGAAAFQRRYLSRAALVDRWWSILKLLRERQTQGAMPTIDGNAACNEPISRGAVLVRTPQSQTAPLPSSRPQRGAIQPAPLPAPLTAPRRNNVKGSKIWARFLGTRPRPPHATFLVVVPRRACLW